MTVFRERKGTAMLSRKLVTFFNSQKMTFSVVVAVNAENVLGFHRLLKWIIIKMIEQSARFYRF